MPRVFEYLKHKHHTFPSVLDQVPWLRTVIAPQSNPCKGKTTQERLPRLLAVRHKSDREKQKHTQTCTNQTSTKKHLDLEVWWISSSCVDFKSIVFLLQGHPTVCPVCGQHLPEGWSNPLLIGAQTREQNNAEFQWPQNMEKQWWRWWVSCVGGAIVRHV